MSAGKWDRKFIQFWYNEWMDSAVRKELCIGGQGIFFNLLAMVARSRYEGKLCATEDCGYTIEQLCKVMKADKKLMQKTLDILSKPHGDDKVSTITIDLYGVIIFNNWSKYQPDSRFDKSKWDDKKNTPSAKARSGDAKEVYNYYREKIQPNSKPLESHLKKIGVRLTAYSVKELKVAVDRFAANPWRMKHNKGEGATWFFRSDHQIETFMNLSSEEKDPKSRDNCGEGEGEVV